MLIVINVFTKLKIKIYPLKLYEHVHVHVHVGLTNVHYQLHFYSKIVTLHVYLLFLTFRVTLSTVWYKKLKLLSKWFSLNDPFLTILCDIFPFSSIFNLSISLLVLPGNSIWPVYSLYSVAPTDHMSIP